MAVPLASTPSGAVSGLSLDQAKAALARDGAVYAAADSIGVHRPSIYNWFKGDPNFKQAIQEVRSEWNERLIDDEPLVFEPPTFDTTRQNSTLFAISGGESRPPRPPSRARSPAIEVRERSDAEPLAANLDGILQVGDNSWHFL